MKAYVCLYSVEYMTIDSGDLKVDYGLIYADNFTDAVTQLEQDIYGEDLMKINKLAVETCYWPLYEVIDGKYIVNYKPANKLPIEEFLRPQKRFKHMFKPGNEWMIEEFQKEVDKRWDELLKLEEITNSTLHDAILIATWQGNNFNRVYIDNEGGCNIKFSNKMNIDNIKLFLINLNPKEDKSLEDIDVQYYENYEFTDNNECIIYAPDSFNYNSED